MSHKNLQKLKKLSFYLQLVADLESVTDSIPKTEDSLTAIEQNSRKWRVREILGRERRNNFTA
ncbi:hypothetical protein HC931_12640 [Candidatus Gracilibacteria bacterium]|nr:hypothetical protein [Candidatus Gracilibacteria bacterium]NJM86796.1 hypothetical protein [Hydrococcus sp. RU_2_2]NJP17770.1 hypothetical protein [Hydrococcus sp. CRU_1_1]